MQLMKESVKDYEFSSLIHGDIKSVNFIIQNPEDIANFEIDRLGIGRHW